MDSIVVEEYRKAFNKAAEDVAKPTDDSFIERWNKNIAIDFDKALEVIRDNDLAQAKPKAGYVPLEMYQEMIVAERDNSRKLQDTITSLQKEIEEYKYALSVYCPVSPVTDLPERRVMGRFVSGREDIADRGFEKIVPDTEWKDQDDYYLLHTLRESNRRFRNRKFLVSQTPRGSI